jgi:hypothetical protein
MVWVTEICYVNEEGDETRTYSKRVMRSWAEKKYNDEVDRWYAILFDESSKPFFMKKICQKPRYIDGDIQIQSPFELAQEKAELIQQLLNTQNKDKKETFTAKIYEIDEESESDSESDNDESDDNSESDDEFDKEQIMVHLSNEMAWLLRLLTAPKLSDISDEDIKKLEKKVRIK